MDIQITTKKSGGVERLLEVSVPAESVRDAEERAARRYASQVRLPGFRKGKAPPAMVRKRFAQAIRQEALESLVQEAYKAVLVREQLEHLREQRANWTPIEDKPAPGDMVTVMLATGEGDELADAREYRLVIGEGQAIPGIEEVIMEATPGSTIERPV